jgi:hypothetical protein
MNTSASRLNRVLFLAALTVVITSLLSPLVKNMASQSAQNSSNTAPPSSIPTTGDDAVSEDSVPNENLDENFYDNVVKDAADFEAQSNDPIDPAVGKSFVSDRTLRTSTLKYPFPTTWPERIPPVRYNPFVYGISHLYDSGAGIWQAPYIPSFRESTGSEFSCSPKKFIGLMACGVGSTNRGRYQVIIERFQTDSLNWDNSDELEITVYAEGIRGDKKFSFSVLQSHFSISKCVYPTKVGTINLKKIRVGQDDVFVLSVGNGYLPKSETRADLNEFNQSVTIIAMNESGMPEVVAGYEIGELSQVAATDRSLILTSGSGQIYDEDSPYGTGQVFELTPTANGWKEKIHSLTDGQDPLWGIANADIQKVKTSKGLGRPLTLINYSSLSHTKNRATYCPVDK